MRDKITTSFKIGNITFGLYYPIDIKINSATSICSVTYNTDNINPLFDLQDTTLTQRIYESGTLKLLSITIPVYQFQRVEQTETTNSELGFLKKYLYQDSFYAIRIFNYINSTWSELDLTMSNFEYDTTTATAKIAVDETSKQITVEIPYVFFTNGQIGEQLKLEVYTSYGELDVDISKLPDSTISVNYGSDGTSTYSKVLSGTDTLYLRAVDNAIAGGSNGTAFADAKDIVVYGTGNTAPITAYDLENTLAKYGYGYSKYSDDIAERICIASKYLTFLDELPVESFNGQVYIDAATIRTLGCVKSTSSKITILPNAIYQVITGSTKAIILDDTARNNILNLSPANLVSLINDSGNKYLTYPYHVCIDTSTRYPSAATYDLFNTTGISHLMFETSHKDIKYVMNVVTATISMDTNGTTGYALRIAVSKGNDVSINTLTAVITTKNENGELMGWVGTYEGELTSSNVYLFRFDIPCDFLFGDGTISLANSLEYSNTPVTSTMVNLVNDWKVIMYIDKDQVPTVVPDTTLQSYLPDIIANSGIVGVNTTNMSVTLGTKLDVISNQLTAYWSADTYETYDSDEVLTYTSNVIEKDANGIPVYTKDENNHVVFTIAHHIGDTVLDADGNTVYKHRKGDTKLGLNGKPIVVDTGSCNYSLELGMYNYSYVILSQKVEQSPMWEIRGMITDVVTDLDTVTAELENDTAVVFKPMATIGTTIADVNNSDLSTVTIDLGLSFAFTYYVSAAVANNTSTMTSIMNRTISVIHDNLASSDIIALSVIMKQLHASLTEVYSIESTGFNDGTLQTIINQDSSKKFVIKSTIAYDSLSGSYYSQRAINITYKVVPDSSL